MRAVRCLGRKEHQPVDTRLGELCGLPGSHPAAGRDADLQVAKPGGPLDSIRGGAKAGERGGSAGGREPVPVPAVSARDRPAIRRRAVALATSGIGCWGGRGRASMTNRPWYSGCWSCLPEDCDYGMCTPSWARRRGKSKRYSELVTLADALDREDPAARHAMIARTQPA